MIKSLVSVLSVSLVCTLLPGQAPPGPAEQLGKLERLIGTWTGKGTVTMEPSAAATTWTATATCKKVLSGHFIRRDMVVKLGPEAPGDLRITSFLGWDREQSRYVAVGISNMGQAKLTELHWDGADTIVSCETGIVNGAFTVTRWTTQLGTDGFAIKGLRAVGGGEFFTHAEGKFRKSELNPIEATGARAAGDAAIAAAPVAFVPVGEEMQQLHKIAGTYKVKGWFIMDAGMPKTDFTATEKIESILGGTIVEMTVKGDPIEGWPGIYEGWAALCWDPQQKRYHQVYLNNMGQVSSADGWFADDDTMVFMASGLEMGKPSAGRMTIKLGPNGAVKDGSAHGLMGTAAPMQTYGGTYEKQ